MKTIKQILEDVREGGYAAGSGFDRNDGSTVDQALSEIQELLDGAKPEFELGNRFDMIASHKRQAVTEYQENILKVMK